MNKERLRSILSTEYNADEWREVLRDIFGARMMLQQAKAVALPANNLANRAFELGSFQTSDGRLVGLYQVDLKDNVRIGQNRVGLRTLLRNIYKYDVDAALVAFVQNDKWRLSLISEIRVRDVETDQAIEQKTEPKRFTYLLGEGETVTTARDRLLLLAGQSLTLEKLIDAFSVEKLTKAFFKRYKELFGEFCSHLTATAQYRELFLNSPSKPKGGWKDPAAKPIRDFAKILLGRMVFLQFLQKKGWMGVPAGETAWENGDAQFLKNLFERTRNKDQFHSKALRVLFFETLNHKRKGDLADPTLGNSIRIPYLNGGLFDTDISTGKAVDFPKQLFSDVLDFFEQYNFTIDEDDPYDREVGIDPEMLGHIFENLLEENREKGAFYTPKEIVHYMCQESLIEYFATHLPVVDRPAIEKLVRENQVADDFTTITKATEIDRRLRDVKICDPAIGSGAFPMGLLKEIFECRRLIYPYLKTNETFDPARIKKEIIQNNIYGVDIDNGAVEIARLRFWLALVVDEIEPAPLPNLDYKIMQGNSLLERFEDVDLSNLVSADDDTGVMISEVSQPKLDQAWEAPVQVTIFDSADKEQLFELINQYFDTDGWEERHHEHLDKASLKRQINDIVEGKIHAHVLHERRQLEAVISKYEKKLELAKGGKLEKTTRDYKAYLRQKKRLASFDEIETKLIDLQNSESKPYFLWHLWFKDVFNKGKFDIIIANPPYVQLQKMGKEADVLHRAGFRTFVRTGDIYCLFYEKGFELLKVGGVLTYITSNKWMRGGYGKSLRDYFTKVNTQKIVNLGPGVFHSATVDTSIYVGKNERFDNSVKGSTVESRSDISSLSDDALIPMRDVSQEAWVVMDENDLKIAKAFERSGTPLRDWNTEIYRGILTGFNEAFIIDQAKRDELVAEDPKTQKLIKPILKGREIERYYAEWSRDYIIFLPWHFPLENDENIVGASIKAEASFKSQFSSLYKYFLENRRGLENRNKAETGIRYEWYALQRCAATYKDEFKKEKVIWKRIGSIMRFAYSNEEMYCLDSTCIATGEKIKYLTAVLNSKASLYQLFKTSPQTGTGDQIISVQALEPLLVHYPSDEIEAKFNLTVDYILFVKKAKRPVSQNVANENISSFFEDVVDMMVYELYFEKEMKAKELDVLRFITKKTFPEISNAEDPTEIVRQVYFELQQKDNPVRNRILVANSRSETISRINAVTDKG
jgi:adenine-specific DNA-methyltransferase